MPLYRYAHTTGPTMTAGAALARATSRAPECGDGALESLSRRVDKLTGIVCALVDTLPLAAQRELMAEHGPYDVVEVL